MSHWMNRPNKTARGMTKTAERSKHKFNTLSPALPLSVRGTTDRIIGIRYRTDWAKSKPCPCCGAQHRKLVLNENGKSRLRLLQELRMKRIFVGKTIRPIEVAWRGKVVAIERHNGDLMLRCISTMDADDVRWFSPNNVVAFAS